MASELLSKAFAFVTTPSLSPLAFATTLAALAVTAYVRKFYKRTKLPRVNRKPLPKQGNPEDKITLVGFGKMGTVTVDASPFTAKMDVWLRWSGLPYEMEQGVPGLAPTKTVPYLKHGEHKVSDSTFMIKYLRATYGDAVKIKQPSNPTDAAVALALQRMIEEHLRWFGVYHRWSSEQSFQVLTRDFLPKVPKAARTFIFKSLRARALDTIYRMGIGRFCEADMLEMAAEEIQAVATLLGDKPYVMGDEPCDLDATMFGFMDTILNDGCGSAIGTLAADHPNLIKYVARIRKELYGKEMSCPFAK